MTDRRGHSRSRGAAPLVAAVLALGLVACAPTPASSPSVAPTAAETAIPTGTPTAPPPTTVPTGTATVGASACAAADLKASHGLVEGAAGSLLTSVILVSQVACSVALYPAFGLRDGNGAALLGGVAGGPGRIDLSPDASYESAVRLANWCAPDPTFPLALVLMVGADGGVEELAVTGSSFPDEGDMPPCNGGGGPILEAGAWTPAS